MKRFKIKSIQDTFFQEAWELYLTAFPINERRELSVQEKIMEHKDFSFEIITIDEAFVGFITWWQFDGLRYIEHFATLDKHRGKGYGKSIFQEFLLESEGLSILEVEHPNTIMDERRIGFYERLNFILNPYKYKQLPYRSNGLKVDLLIMSYPKAIEESILRKFERDFREKCYEGFIV